MDIRTGQILEGGVQEAGAGHVTVKDFLLLECLSQLCFEIREAPASCLRVRRK
jgi:hypothetical protein